MKPPKGLQLVEKPSLEPKRAEKTATKTSPARPTASTSHTGTAVSPHVPRPKTAKVVKVSGHISAKTKDAVDAFARARKQAFADDFTTVQDVVSAAYRWFFVEKDGDRKVLQRSCSGEPPYDTHVPVKVSPELAALVKALPRGRKGAIMDAAIGTFVLQVAPKRAQ